MFRKKLIYLIFIQISYIILLCLSYPIKNNKINHQHQKLLVPPPEIINFMKKYGYLDSSSVTTNFDSESLYHETAIIEGIKNIQKFGALNQTGILNDETFKLIKSPRCGVADINNKKSRSKRYIIGSERWRKRNLTYFIANWSPQIGEENVSNGLKKAFMVWAPYCYLNFNRIYDPSADIIIAFGTRYHGDNYPFDGPGNVLAHAFYPEEMQSLSGDIHFDYDENWKENSTNLADGVDFFSVAVHELGHSLGLGHSTVYSSIMFPYYKGAGSYALDFDDIFAMYELYVKIPIENDVNENEFITETTPTFPTTEQQEETTFSTTYEGDYETVYAHKYRNRTSTTTEKIKLENTDSFPTLQTVQRSSVNNSTDIPNICEGNFDAVAELKRYVFIFKGEYVWKITKKYKIASGYPIKIIDMFPFLQNITMTIDAIYERHTDNATIIFSGHQFWVYDGNILIENSPKEISEFGINENITKINAAMVWSKNHKTYLFSDNKFWRYNDETRLMDPDYPKTMKRWIGIPENIDAVTTIQSGKTYFFKGNLYWLYDNIHIRPAIGYPRQASNVWIGCPLT